MITMKEVLNQILHELHNVNNRLEHLEKGQERLETKQAQFQVTQEAMQERQDRFQAAQEAMQERQDRFQTTQESIQAKQDQFEKSLGEVKSGQDQLKDNLINGLGPYFEQIEKHIDAKTEEIRVTLEDQQRMTDTLAARSIKHESDIKDFKRILRNQ